MSLWPLLINDLTNILSAMPSVMRSLLIFLSVAALGSFAAPIGAGRRRDLNNPTPEEKANYSYTGLRGGPDYPMKQHGYTHLEYCHFFDDLAFGCDDAFKQMKHDPDWIDTNPWPHAPGPDNEQT